MEGFHRRLRAIIELLVRIEETETTKARAGGADTALLALIHSIEALLADYESDFGQVPYTAGLWNDLAR